MRQRKNVIQEIENSKIGNIFTIIENDSGLHFILKVKEGIGSENFHNLLRENGIHINSLSDYYFSGGDDAKDMYIINYSMISKNKMREILDIMENIIKL